MNAAAGVLLEFIAQARPAPQGSHRPVITAQGAGGARPRTVVDPGTGRTVVYGAKKQPRVFMKDSSAGLGAYRDAVALTARAAAARAGLDAPLAEPVATLLRFEFPRPKNGRAWPDSRATGDIDKLERAVHDALTMARVIDDDCRIVGGAKIMAFSDDLSGPGRTIVRMVGIATFMDMLSPGMLTLPDISG